MLQEAGALHRRRVADRLNQLDPLLDNLLQLQALDLPHIHLFKPVIPRAADLLKPRARLCHSLTTLENLRNDVLGNPSG
jgi:hypothetical protein